MYAAKERETLVIETAHILSFGLFLCPQAFEKVSVDIGCKRKLTQNSFISSSETINESNWMTTHEISNKLYPTIMFD